MLLVLLIASCIDPKEELVDFNDIAPQSENYNEDDTERDVEHQGDTLLKVKGIFTNGGIKVDELFPLKSSLFPDRFGPERTEKYLLISGSDSIHFQRWVYQDSVKTFNAFYNWIDCFTSKCKSYYVNENANMQKKAFKILVNDTVLCFIESNSTIDYNAWDIFYDSLSYERSAWDFIIEQRKRGIAKWYIFDEDERKTPYKE